MSGRGFLGGAAVVAAVIVAIVVMGQFTANLQADAGSTAIGQEERNAVVEQARIFWDNPFQRLAFRAFAVRPVDGTGPDPCGGREDTRMYEVTAYTLFGVALDRINCRASSPDG